ncbi:hypothetical protein RchiOBHm_Chr5g0081731 [Rosa chinensis]|uniref:Uncharacterized protein n=1 Tax=Rosa chinensis TaxID=74649 RepID=A0A2P6QN57_ROSCH|nr:hypothetical protein RchiOBHm_Chr5g0081731 [Rosa chinensis]
MREEGRLFMLVFQRQVLFNECYVYRPSKTLPGMSHRDAALHESSGHCPTCSLETLLRHVFLLHGIVEKPVNTKKVKIMEERESQPL